MSIVCARAERRPRGGNGWAARLRAGGAAAAALFAHALVAVGAHAEPVAVEVANLSEPVLCAEKDNVTLTFASAAVKSFRITALHPAYIGSLTRDSTAADWTACTAPGDPGAGPARPPQRITLYEDIEMWLVGLRFADFWRPAAAKVRVGDRLESGIHLLQLWMLRPMGGEEVLVLYPQDGYWRLRPKAPADKAPTAFGSSVLIGPVEVEGRPLVNIRQVAFDPERKTFTIDYARGGSAKVRLARLDETSHDLEVTFDQPVAGGLPFAALRSMYVTDVNNDVAHVAVREAGAKGWRQDGIMGFRRAAALELWAGRVSPSRHNTSAPDLLFGAFGDTADAAAPAK